MNTLIDIGVSVFLGRMQRPAGKTLISVGQGLQAVGQDLEILGHALVDSAPASVQVSVPVSGSLRTTHTKHSRHTAQSRNVRVSTPT